MKIHEVIYFTHELDMLEAHLEEHQHFVDKFFIKESPVLWTGVEKDLIFTENADRFSRFNIEIIVMPASEFDLSIPTTFPEEEYKKWFDVRRNNRGYSRTYRWDDIREGADYVLSMDCDEIIDQRNAHEMLEMMTSREYEALALTLRQCQFWVNTPGKKLRLYRVIRGDMPYLYNVKHRPRNHTPMLGWHFTNCYTPEDIRTKVLGITTHYGFCGVDNVPNAETIEKMLEERKNPFTRRWTKGNLVEDSDKVISPSEVLSREDCSWAPKYIRENPDKFPWYKEKSR